MSDPADPAIFNDCAGCNQKRRDVCTLFISTINRERCPCVKCLVKVMCQSRCEKRILAYFNKLKL